MNMGHSLTIFKKKKKYVASMCNKMSRQKLNHEKTI